VKEARNRVVQVRRFGGPEDLEVVDAPLPRAGRNEVRVRVLASGLEYTDVVIRRHLYPQTMRRRPPFVLGYDVVGEIDQVGDGVRGFQLADRVADLTVLGSNAGYRTLRASDLTRVPAGVDAAEAAALILSWTTAYQLLHRAARVQQGERVLVQGAAGAVGQALVVLGRLAGLELWGTARSVHAALIRELGATPIDYQREDVTRILPGGFDVVFDGIGENGYRRSFAALKRGGMVCAYGYTARVQAQRRLLTILMWIARVYLWRRLLSWLPGGKRLRVYSINVMRARHPTWFQEDLERLFGLLATGTIRPRVAERISFNEVAEAHRRLEAAVSRASSFYAPTFRCGAAGCRLEVSPGMEFYEMNNVVRSPTTHLGPNKSGLVLGSLVGGWHLLWAIVVAVGWGQPWIDFIFWLHFLKPVFVVEPFAIGRAIVLILVTAAIGYLMGLLGAVFWNRLQTR
jgi:NADPH:quinone reductase-like Zn-dependent oxidoreductase